jgi:copper homeostasis protein CutC
VTEATPQFRNFIITNVVCNGAAKGIFIRGLPEMNVQHIQLQDMVIEAKEGLDMTEGNGITMKNVQLITNNTNPVMNIHNSSDITLDNIRYRDNSDLLLNVSGEKSKGIRLNGTDVKKAKKSLELSYGATEGAVKLN